MAARLILAIISTLLEEAALVAIVLWALPEIGVHIPLPGLIVLMVAWLAYSVLTYRVGSRALRKRPLVSLPEMVGGKGEVVSLLAPEGLVRIKGELWVARSDGKQMGIGTEVIVVEQDGLKLVVRESSASDDLAGTE